MSDSYGLKAAADRGIALGEVGQRIVLENEHVRIWEVRLEPGETIDFHIHYHPYVVISLGGGENEIETIFGQKIKVEEPLTRPSSSTTCAPCIGSPIARR